MLNGYCVISDYSKDAVKMFELMGVNLKVSASATRPNEEELKKLVQEYDILIIGAKEKMTPAVYNCATKLKVLGTLSIGLDHIASEFLHSDKIKVFNCPKSNVVSVAEHTFGLILALQKKVIEGNQAVLQAKGRSGINGLPHDLFGKKIGVIGAGRIATEVMNLAQAFHMEVSCYTFHPERHMDIQGKGVKFVALEKLLRESDIVTLHIALSKLSERFMDAQKIAVMKDSAILINTSREQVMDTAYALDYAAQHPNFKVGLDIETDDLDMLTRTYSNNVLITPHIAGVSLEAIIRMDTELAATVVDFLKLQ